MENKGILMISIAVLFLTALAPVFAEIPAINFNIPLVDIIQKLNNTYNRLKDEEINQTLVENLNKKINENEKLKTAISTWNGFDFSIDIQYKDSPIFQISMIIENSTVKSISLDAKSTSQYTKIYVSADLVTLNTLATKLNLLESGKYEWWQWIVFFIWDVPSTFIRGVFTKEFVVSPWYAGVYTIKWVQFLSGFVNLQEAFANIQNTTVV